MLSLAEAQARLLALAAPLAPVRLPLDAARGHALVENLRALRTQPEAPLSAMDGYALACAASPGPWLVAGESAAGKPFAGRLKPGEAVRISTGAIVPAGADSVLIQENAALKGNQLRLAEGEQLKPGANIRARGLDFGDGDTLLAAGLPLNPARLALAAMGGHGAVTVNRAPTLAIIETGDELQPPGIALGMGQIPASNGLMLGAMLARLPVGVSRRAPVPDQLEAIVAALREATACDIIVTIGGASVGDHDLIRPALAAIGIEPEFWKVAIKPGKPLLVAAEPGGPILLGLPGNPASAYVTATLFLLPLLRRMLGYAETSPRIIPAILAGTLPATGKRAEFPRGVWDGRKVRPLGLQDSGMVSPLATANALILRPSHSLPASEHDAVSIIVPALDELA